MVDVNQVLRRQLKFSCQNCIMGDIDKLARGRVRSTGNWSPGRIVQHITEMINGSLDGFPPEMKAPIVIRIPARFLKKRMLGRPWQPGIRLPKQFEALLPPGDIEFETARENLRRAVRRLETEQMQAKSPVFGPMSHQDWMKLHCRHAELHFSFLHPEEAAT